MHNIWHSIIMTNWLRLMITRCTLLNFILDWHFITFSCTTFIIFWIIYLIIFYKFTFNYTRRRNACWYVNYCRPHTSHCFHVWFTAIHNFWLSDTPRGYRLTEGALETKGFEILKDWQCCHVYSEMPYCKCLWREIWRMFEYPIGLKLSIFIWLLLFSL